MNDIRETIGCDLGDKTSTLFILGVRGQSERPKAIRTTKQGFTKFFSQRSSAHVIVETGTHSRWVHELLTRFGHTVTVANAYRLSLISRNHKKSDDTDAELLARLGRSDAALLSPVVHRGHHAQSELAILKAREALVEVRTKLVNHVRGTIKQFGERLPSCGAAVFHRKTREWIPAHLKAALLPLYQALTDLAVQIKGYDQTIEALVTSNPDMSRLRRIPGVGPIIAASFVSVLDDPSRFRTSRAVPAYLGLLPRRSQSGAHDPDLRISKTGNMFLRRLLVIGANHILGPFGKDSELRQWGLALANRGGKNAKKRAKVAVARKLAVILHRVWISQRDFEPFFQTHRLGDPQTAAT